jgi:2-aminoadipate transaminase
MACAAVGYGYGARLSQRMRAEHVICWALVIALPLTLPLAWLDAPQRPCRPAWWGFGYVAVFSMWLGFFAWYRGLALGGTVRVSQVQLVQPFLSMLFAVPLLGERLDAHTSASPGRDRHRLRRQENAGAQPPPTRPPFPSPWSKHETRTTCPRHRLDPGAPRRAHEPVRHPRDPEGHRAPGIISFAGGLPSPRPSRSRAFAEACAKVLRDDGPAALQYAASEGYGPLREQVAAMLPWPVDPAQVLITTGSQQGLDLVAKVLIDAGSRVLVETPTYLGALQAFAPMEPEVVGVPATTKAWTSPTSRQGAGRALPLRAAELPEPDRPHDERGAPRRRCRPPPRELGLPLSKTTPTATSGSTRRRRAADRAQPGRLHLPRLLLQGAGARPAPGLPGRAAAIAPKLLQAKQAADLHSPSFNQRMVVRGDAGRLPGPPRADHPRLYKSQRDAMLAALEREMRGLDVHLEHARRRHVPVGAPARRHDAVDLLPKAVERGVAFVPGAAFYADETRIRAPCACPS